MTWLYCTEAKTRGAGNNQNATTTRKTTTTTTKSASTSWATPPTSTTPKQQEHQLDCDHNDYHHTKKTENKWKQQHTGHQQNLRPTKLWVKFPAACPRAPSSAGHRWRNLAVAVDSRRSGPACLVQWAIKVLVINPNHQHSKPRLMVSSTPND